MDYKYNEIEYAKLIYEKGLQSQNHMPTELRLTATYMRRILGYKPKKLKEEFDRWCSEHIADYNKASYYKIINRAINQALKKGSTLIRLDTVSIYKTELDYINHCSVSDEHHIEYEDSYLCKKLMFALMVQLKINNAVSEMKNTEDNFTYNSIYFQGGQKKYTGLKKMAKLPDRTKVNEDVIHYLYTSGLVTPLHSGVIRLDFMKDIYEMDHSGSEPEIIIDDFERTGWYFDYYNKEKNIKLCEHCKKPYKKKSNHQKYCNECAPAVNVKKQKIRDSKKS